MAMQKKTEGVKKMTKNERYLSAVFSIFKRRENIAISEKRGSFNDTELRLIGEVLTEKYQGNRLISTEIAKRLGITRSAVSQIVNRLEAEGVVKRLPAETDKKIAYVEITDGALERYQKDIAECTAFVGKVVKQYGEERFERLCADLNAFMETMEEEKKK